MTTPLYDVKRDRFKMAVADAIRAARLAAGLSQRSLAEKAALSHAMIVSIESGHTLCSLWAAAQISEVLDTTIDAIAPVLIDEKEAAE